MPPYVRKRGKTWSFTIDIGKDPLTGKRRQKTVSGFATEEEARREGYLLEEKVKKGINVSVPTLEEFIRHYMENNVKFEVTDSTYANQMYFVEKFIIPYLGKHRMDQIKYTMIEEFYARLLKNGASRGLIKNIAMVLRKTFRAAETREVIYKNVVRNVKPPKYKPAKMNVWTKEQVQEFLEKAKSLDEYPMYVLELTTGLRIGELLGLHWEDIDWLTGSVRIVRSLKYDHINGRHLKDLKNEHSRRTIMLPEFTLDVLREHKNNSDASVGFVFHHFGEPHYPSNISRKFRRDAERLGLPPIRFHDLRHTHATILLQEGFNPKVVAERLGHASIVTLLNTYAHVLPSMQQEVADRLDRLFGDAGKDVETVDNTNVVGKLVVNQENESEKMAIIKA